MEFEFLSQLISKSNGRFIPLWGQFELLPVCNLQCPMCYIHKPAEDNSSIRKLLPASFWIDIARQAVDAGMLVLSITGGETLLYPELDMLLDALSQMGIIISFNTNGTLIDERQVERLAKYSIAKINISIYGGSDETYKKVTGLHDGFSRVNRAIDLLQAAGQNVYLNGVLVPDNRKDLPIMLKYAASKGLVLHETTYLFPRRDRFFTDVNEYNPDSFRMTPQEAAEASRECSRIMKGDRDYRISAAIAANHDHVVASLSECPSRKGECRAGRYEFAVDWRGYMQPCVLLPAIREDLREQSFDRAWEKCISRMKGLPFPEKCSTCSHLENCPVCPAAIYLETGTHNEAPDYLCRLSEELLKIWERDSKGIRVKIEKIEGTPVEVNARGCER